MIIHKKQQWVEINKRQVKKNVSLFKYPHCWQSDKKGSRKRISGPPPSHYQKGGRFFTIFLTNYHYILKLCSCYSSWNLSCREIWMESELWKPESKKVCPQKARVHALPKPKFHAFRKFHVNIWSSLPPQMWRPYLKLDNNFDLNFYLIVCGYCP